MAKFEVNVQSGNSKSHFTANPKDVVVKIADIVAKQVQSKLEPIIIKAATGVGKSTELLNEIYKKMPNYTIICT